ncbi:MAG: 4-(cytidine 5'-diphospho)-2-C-methyl-D-erythritol kinase [Planctomycetaceae bacterium]|jgi:4-diphosphocytidyl-2-C-methyl-D-erythritol kinase|nr:4-(cytidine 5'-diphospho)-2-C-methyl-D-erythritol kinase [Planctomycetaceae bacterium]
MEPVLVLVNPNQPIIVICPTGKRLLGEIMFLYKSKACWTVYTPAKLNLFFEVYGKREDGFHEIVSIAVPIRIFDMLIFEPTQDKEIDFSCPNSSADIPNDENNLVFRAMKLLQERAGVVSGARIRLFKRIPSRAGLGGGSSDAAAVLQAARQIWRLKISDEELIAIAAEIGSDCPIFFHRRASFSSGRGERVRLLGLMPKLHFVILKPDEGLPTATVYQHCMPCHDRQFQYPEQLIAELQRGDLVRIGRCFFNRLEKPARVIWESFDRIKSELERVDCLAVCMSGSGTAFYGLCRNDRHAKFVAGQLRQRVARNYHIFVTSN